MHGRRMARIAGAVGGSFLPGSLLAATIYTNAAATGANTGTSWADAFPDLSAALAAAGPGAELWVAAGTYRPTPGADRTISFPLKNGVGVYGGFAGTETLRSQRDPAGNPTTLSGDVGVAGDSSDNSFHVVTADGAVSASTVLDGFTISGGRADGAAAPTTGAAVSSTTAAARRSPAAPSPPTSPPTAGAPSGSRAALPLSRTADSLRILPESPAERSPRSPEARSRSRIPCFSATPPGRPAAAESTRTRSPS